MSKFIEASKNMQRLQSEDIVNAILYAIQVRDIIKANSTGKMMMINICCSITNAAKEVYSVCCHMLLGVDRKIKSLEICRQLL
jgi:uncharacterized metal-binding protein